MPKPRKKIINGKAVWIVRLRENGKHSRQINRRFNSAGEAHEFVDAFQARKWAAHHGDVQLSSVVQPSNLMQPVTIMQPPQTTTINEPKFAQEAEYWLDDIKLRVSPGHYRRAKDIIDDFNKTQGKLEVRQITAQFMTRLQKELKMRPGKTRTSQLSNASVNRYTKVIYAVLTFSVLQRRIAQHPVVGFRKLPRTSQEMLFWEEEEAVLFLAWASDKYTELSNKDRLKARSTYVAYLLAINTGMRAGELWGLKPRDLSFSNDGEMGDTIFVRRQLNTITGEYAPLKGGTSSNKDKSRHVPCSKILREELQAIIRFNKIGDDEPIFQNCNGNAVGHAAAADKFRLDLKKWGGRRIRFHDLRHTAATLMLAKGVDVKTVSEILGHEDLTTTMGYVHLLGGQIQQVSKFFSIGPAAPIKKPTLSLITNS